MPLYYPPATGGGGGGGTSVSGTAIVDFGAFPGSDAASVTITGQSAIVAGSKIEAWIYPKDTADHSADEHMIDTIRAAAHTIVAGVGFTITAVNISQLNEPVEDNLRRGRGGLGTELYGQYTVAWRWE